MASSPQKTKEEPCSSENSTDHEEGEESYEEAYSSESSVEARERPSRSNRGTKMNFLLANEKIITESRADKGYAKLFCDSDSSDSLDDSAEYSSSAGDSSDSFDSDFEDEARGIKAGERAEASEDSSSSSEEEPQPKRQKKVPKRPRGRPPLRAAVKEVEAVIETDKESASPKKGKGPAQKKPLKTEKERCRQPGRNQAEKMASALRMRAHNLALREQAAVPTAEDPSIAKLSAKELKAKYPFFFYDASGYRTITRDSYEKKHGSKTIYMFPMGPKEYATIFPARPTEESPLQFLQRRLIERAQPAPDAIAAGNPASKYAYKYNEDNAGGTDAVQVPYPIARRGEQKAPVGQQRGLMAKGGRLVLHKGGSIPGSDVLGCRGPYRDPFTGINYKDLAQFAKIRDAVQTVRSFWGEKGYAQEWEQAWGTQDSVEKDAKMRHALFPLLVEEVLRSEKG